MVQSEVELSQDWVTDWFTLFLEHECPRVTGRACKVFFTSEP